MVRHQARPVASHRSLRHAHADSLRMADRLLTEGTYNASGEPYVGGGYLVSLPGFERVTSDPVAIAAWVRSVRLGPGQYLGAWRDGDRLYLDVSEVIHDPIAAVAAGRARGQLAIWDATEEREVRL